MFFSNLGCCCASSVNEKVAFFPVGACGDECSEDDGDNRPAQDHRRPAPAGLRQLPARCRSCIGTGRLHGDLCYDCGGTGKADPIASESTVVSAIKGLESLDRKVPSLEAVVAALPPGACRVCVLGATKEDGCEHVDGEALVVAVAKRFGSSLAGRTAVLTCGLPGTQSTFAKNLGPAFPLIVHLVPEGLPSRFGVGQDLCLGDASLEERLSLFGQLGHVFLVFEGGPDVAEAALLARASGALVLPMSNVAGSAAGFPLSVLKRPLVAGADQWAALIHGDLPEAVAKACVSIVKRYLASQGSTFLVQSLPSEPGSRIMSRQSGSSDKEVRKDAPRAVQLFRSAHLFEAAELLTRMELDNPRLPGYRNVVSWWERLASEIEDSDLRLLAFIYGGLMGLLLRVATREGFGYTASSRHGNAAADERRARQARLVGAERLRQMSMHIVQSTEEMKGRGWEDCSPYEEGIDMLTFVRIDFDAKRTFMTSTSVIPHAFEHVLPMLAEVELVQEWFPFCTMSKVLHRWSDSVLLVQAVVKLPVISFELIFVLVYEDHFDEAGCFGIYMVSPPTDVLFEKESVDWMGAEIPPAMSERFSWRVPLADARLLYFPISENETRVKCEVAEIHIISPATWITHFFYTEVSKRINPVIDHFLESTGDRLRTQVEARPSFYERWFALARRQLANGLEDNVPDRKQKARSNAPVQRLTDD